MLWALALGLCNDLKSYTHSKLSVSKFTKKCAFTTQPRASYWRRSRAPFEITGLGHRNEFDGWVGALDSFFSLWMSARDVEIGSGQTQYCSPRPEIQDVSLMTGHFGATEILEQFAGGDQSSGRSCLGEQFYLPPPPFSISLISS